MATQPPSPPGAPGWPPHHPTPADPQHRGTALWILVAVSTIVSIAALVLGIIAVSNTAQAPAEPSPAPSEAPALAAPILFDDNADRALCQALPDLMKQRNAADQAFMALPPAQTPERDAAIPGYKAEVRDWAQRTQKVLAAHATPDRYLTRTLQRLIDDTLLYSQNIHPRKPADPFDEDTWNSGVVAYGGPLGRCYQLGIRWSK